MIIQIATLTNMSTINKETKAEESAVAKWERELKNKILNMTNVEKKQELWKQNFPVMTLSDEWMTEAVMF